MTAPISDSAVAARETARTFTGQFGTQPAAEAGLELDADQLYLDPGCHDITRESIDKVRVRAAGPVRAEPTAQEGVDRIRYDDPVAGPVEIYMSDYLTYKLELDEGGMTDWAGPDSVHYATEDGSLRVTVLSLGEDQFSVEMTHDDSGTRTEESYGAAESGQMATDLEEFWSRDFA